MAAAVVSATNAKAALVTCRDRAGLSWLSLWLLRLVLRAVARAATGQVGPIGVLLISAAKYVMSVSFRCWLEDCFSDLGVLRWLSVPVRAPGALLGVLGWEFLCDLA